jgi:prepilin-type N-terminal cleavage/methylation domain-containing protein
MLRQISHKESERGFTLVECIMAMVITVIGLLAALSLIAFAVKRYTVSSDLAIANSLAKSKIEELRNISQAPGGNLLNNTTGYFDQPTSKFIRRWQISTDSMGTQNLSVGVSPAYPGILLPEVNLRTRK